MITKPTWSDGPAGSVLIIESTETSPGITVMIFKTSNPDEGFRVNITTNFKKGKYFTFKILQPEIKDLTKAKAQAIYETVEHLDTIGNAFLVAANSLEETW